MGWIQRQWSNAVTLGCIFVVALIEAWQQAASGVSTSANIPKLQGLGNYVPLVLLVVAGISWIVGKLGRRPPQPSTRQPSTAPVNIFPTLSSILGQQSQVTLDPKEHFRAAYFSPLTAEIEKNIREVARKYDPNDLESFYARFIGVGVVSVMHNATWASIYKSQFLMLTEINRSSGLISVDSTRTFYDEAVKEFPNVYVNYTFDQWLNFMKREQLIIEHPSRMLEITHRAKDFLKYIAHWGGNINDKKG